MGLLVLPDGPEGAPDLAAVRLAEHRTLARRDGRDGAGIAHLLDLLSRPSRSCSGGPEVAQIPWTGSDPGTRGDAHDASREPATSR